MPEYLHEGLIGPLAYIYTSTHRALAAVPGKPPDRQSYPPDDLSWPQEMDLYYSEGAQ